MRRNVFATFVFFAACVAMAGCADDGADTATSGGGDGDSTGGDGDGDGNAVTGTVLDTDGEGIAGATVTWIGQGDAVTATADQSGAYSISIPEGAQDLRVDVRGFVPEVERVDVTASGASNDFELLSNGEFDAALSSIGRTQGEFFGVVEVQFRGGGGGESATVSGTTDIPFALVGGNAVESPALPGGASSLFFTNVDPGFTGRTDVTSPDCTPVFGGDTLVDTSGIVVVELDC